MSAGTIDVRRSVGLLGFAFPFVMMLVGMWRFRVPIPYALSSYYHTPLALLFAGFMVAIGLGLVA